MQSLSKPWLLLLWLAVMATVCYLLQGIYFSNDRWLADDHPQEIALDLVNEQFDKGETLVIILPLSESWFANPEYYHQVQQLENRLLDHEKVISLESPVSGRIAYEHRDEQADYSTLEIGAFKDFISKDIINASTYQKEFIASPYQGRLLSVDQLTAAIKVKMDTYEQADSREQMISFVDELMQSSPWADSYLVVGDPVVKHAINAKTRDDLPRLLAIAGAMIFLAMWLLLSNFFNAVIAALSSFACAAVAMLIMVLTKVPMTAPGLILPILVTTVATADALHIIHYHQSHRSEHPDAVTAIKATFKDTWLPCFLASLTTLLGLGTFLISPLEILAQFSQVAIAGILMAFVVLLSSLAMFMYVFDGVLGKQSSQGVHHRIALLWPKVFPFMISHSKKLAIGIPSILLILGIGLAKLTTESDFLRLFFYPDSDIREAFDLADEKLKGSNNIDLILSGPVDGFASFQALQGAQVLIDQLYELDHALDVESYVTTLSHVHPKLIDDGSILPVDDEQVYQEMFFLDLSQSETEESVLGPHLNFDRSKARVRLRTANLPSAQLANVMHGIGNIAESEQMQGFAELARAEGADLVVTGFGAYLHTLSTYILQTQVQSIVLTVIAIMLLLLVVFPFKLVAMVVAVNLLPLAATAGLISWLGIPYDFGTILVIGACLGLSIDHSLHLMHHYHKRGKVGADLLSICGTPIVLAALVLMAGMGSLVFSSLPLVTRFSVLTCLGIILGVVCSLVLLPIFLNKMDSKSA